MDLRDDHVAGGDQAAIFWGCAGASPIDLTGAIQVLRRARTQYGDNVSILTSLGVDLERARSDQDALEILLPLFDALVRNTRAALAIIRVRIRQGDIPEAERVFRRAKTDVFLG
jgi:Flp pilus assembly protein TadD